MELIIVSPQEFGLSEIQATAIANKFLPVLEDMQPLIDKYNEIKELPPDDPQNSKQFDDLRKKFVKVRTSCAAIHKTEKAFYLAGGKYVDRWKNKQLEVSEPIESDLAEKAKYAEIQEQKRREALRIERSEMLLKFNCSSDNIPNLGDIEDSTFQMILAGAEKSYNDKIEAEKQAEKQAAEKAEADRIAAEEQRKKDIAEAEERAAQKAKEQAELEAAEQIRIANEAAAEAERKAAESIRLSQIEADRKIKEAEAEKQRIAAAELAKKQAEEKAAALAPDKEKLEKYIAALRSVTPPQLSEPESKARLNRFFEKMKMAIAEIS
jgi:hypothetical protein